MPPDDKSNYENRDDYSDDDDLYKQYSLNENKKDDRDFSGEEDEGYIPKRGMRDEEEEHEYLEDQEEAEERKESGREKIEDGFFSDEDFEFKEFDSDRYGDEGLRRERARSKRRKIRAAVTSLVIMALLVAVAIGIVFGYRYIRSKYFGETADTGVSQEETIVIPGTIKLGRDMSIVIATAGGNLLEPQVNSAVFSKYTASSAELVSLCIPANTLFEIPGFGLDSVSKSVEYGGMDLLELTLKNNIGMEVENYLLLDVISIIDSLESIKLNLDSELTITEQGGSEIELKKGDNILNGDTAYSFLSYFSGNTPDVPPSYTVYQKMLIDTMMRKITGTQEGDLAKNLSKLSDYIDTDLNLEELSEFISTVAGLSDEKNRVYALDGRIEPLDEESIVFVPDISKVSDIFNQPGEVTEETPVYETGETVSAVVLNGVGTKGIAGKASELLGGLKFSDGTARYSMSTPADADNYNYANTLIIIKSEDEPIQKAAENVAKVLLTGSISVSEDGTQETDLVIIIGKDFDYDKAVAALSETSTQETAEQTTEETSQETSEDTSGGATEGQTYILNILNGEGTQGIALTVKDILEDNLNKDGKVIEIKETKNADSFNYNVTKIITHTDKT
ncbi:MAG: LytR family transcriptional regulator, partial [Actinobacteria bacterium]|nr:LytR family transcriptional regulator [Actinomycetota bacterium]